MARNPESLKNLKAGNKRGPAKITKALKEAILEAAEAAGGSGGMVTYLTVQASAQPAAFMGLLGKVLPMQITGKDDGPVQVEDVTAAQFLKERLDAIASRATGASVGE